MGKGIITANNGAGLYTVKLIFDTDRVDTRINNLIQKITSLEDRIFLKKIDITNKQIELRLDPNNKELQRDVILLQNQLNILYAEKINCEKTKNWLSSYDFDNIYYSAWCADLSEELSGTVGTVEIPGERQSIQIKPGFSDNASYVLESDGILQHAVSGTPANVYVNWSIFPGWQKWKPTFRYGNITSKSGDYCNIQLESTNSSQQNLDINQSTTLASVPIVYMDCNGTPFEVGDSVLIKFLSQRWDSPQVVGFKNNPKPCAWTEEENWYFDIEMTDGTRLKLDPFIMQAKVTTEIQAANIANRMVRFEYTTTKTNYTPIISTSHMDCHNNVWLNIPRNSMGYYKNKSELYLRSLEIPDLTDPNYDTVREASNMKKIWTLQDYTEDKTYIFDRANNYSVGEIIAQDENNMYLKSWEERWWERRNIITIRKYGYNQYQVRYVLEDDEFPANHNDTILKQRTDILGFSPGVSEAMCVHAIDCAEMNNQREFQTWDEYAYPTIRNGIFDVSIGKFTDSPYVTIEKILLGKDNKPPDENSLQSAKIIFSYGQEYATEWFNETMEGSCKLAPRWSTQTVIPTYCIQQYSAGTYRFQMGARQELYQDFFGWDRDIYYTDGMSDISDRNMANQYTLEALLSAGVTGVGHAREYDFFNNNLIPRPVTGYNGMWLTYDANYIISDGNEVVINEPVSVSGFVALNEVDTWLTEIIDENHIGKNWRAHVCWSTPIEDETKINKLRLAFYTNPIEETGYFKFKNAAGMEADVTNSVMSAINSASGNTYGISDVKFVTTRVQDQTALTQMQKDFLEMINEYRVNEIGVEPLVYNFALNLAAKEKCTDPNKIFYFEDEVWHWDHASADGTNSLDRIVRAGFFDTDNPETEGETAENLGHGVPGTTLQAMFDAWKASPGHNDSMVYPLFKEVGFWDAIGVDWDGNPRYFMVTTFGYSNRHGL